MDYRYDHHRIGLHISNPMPALYDLSQSSTYRTPKLPQVIEAPKLPQVPETYETNPEFGGYTIHELEIEAYVAVLKAFKIQSDLLSWGKEGLITELRRELNVTDQEHRTLLMQINSDESIKMIRELQQGIFTARELPSGVRDAPGIGPNSIYSAPSPNLKLPSDDVSTMQRYVAHSQPMPSPTPQPSSVRNAPGFGPNSVNSIPRHNLKLPDDVSTMQRYVAHSQPMPAPTPQPSVRNTPGLGPNSVKSSSRPNSKLPSDDVSMMQRYVAHSQPVPAPTPQPLLQNWDGSNCGELPASNMRNTGKSLRVVIPRVKKSPESRKRGRIQPHQNNLNHVAEVHKVNNKSGIIRICATETVLSKVQNMVYGSKNPGPDQIEKAKSILMDQERAILEALGKLANVPDEDDSSEGCQDQQVSKEKLSMAGKWANTSRNVYCQVNCAVGLQ